MGLCRQLHDENGLLKMNEDKVRKQLRHAFDRKGGILGVIGEPGRLEAMIYMLVSGMWYSDDPILEELFAYVAPAYRKSRNAVELLHFAKWCSDESGFPLLIGILSNKDTEGKVKLYQRKFDRPAGNFFIYGTTRRASACAGAR